MKQLYLSLVLAFLCFSCAPLYVVRLEPEQTPTRIEYGEKVLTDQQGDIAVSLSYYDANREFLVFNLEVINNGDRPFDFDPATCELAGDAGPVSRAIDPELQLLTMDIETVREAKNQRTWAWIGGGIAVAGLVAGVTLDNAALATETSGILATELALNIAEVATFTVVDAAINRNAARNFAPTGGEVPVPQNRYFWLDHALRITTIAPGQRAFGKIVFPRNDDARRFSLKVDANGRLFSFPFEQRVFRP